jgi:hypothetical protein
VRQSIRDPNWQNPFGLKIFETPDDHSFKCLTTIKNCLISGFDIFTSHSADDFGRYRLSEVGATL